MFYIYSVSFLIRIRNPFLENVTKKCVTKTPLPNRFSVIIRRKKTYNIGMKKVVAASFGFVGTVIGAGFASGKEIALYFGQSGVVTPALSGLILALFAYLFCETGRTVGDPTALFPKGKKPFSICVELSNAAVFCTTVAGSEQTVLSLCGFHGGAIITVLLTLATLFFGKKISSALSVVSVVAILVMIGYLFFASDIPLPTGKFSPLSASVYAGMNMLTGGFFISSMSRDFTKKDSVRTAVLTFFLLTALLLAVFCIGKNHTDETFPLLAAAEDLHVEKLGSAVLFLAMYTTCVGTMTVAGKNVPEKNLALASASLLVSCLGFEKLLSTLYPIIGVLGGFFCVVTAVFYLKEKPDKNNTLSVSDNRNPLVVKNGGSGKSGRKRQRNKVGVIKSTLGNRI